VRRRPVVAAAVTITTVTTLALAACSPDRSPAAVGSTAASRPADSVVDPSLPTVSASPATPTTLTAPDSTIAADTVDGDPPARLTGVGGAAGVADVLNDSVAIVLDESRPEAERVAAGTRQQLALRWLAERPQLDDEVLAGLSPTALPLLRRIIESRQFAAAVRAGRSTPPTLDTTLPAWSIAEPEPIAQLREAYLQAEAATGVPWYWLAAIHLQETRLGRIVGVSSAGAIGPMQFLPTTWAECCTGDPTITRDAVLGAATYLRDSGAPDDMRAALYQYNPNVSYVVAVTSVAEILRDAPAMLVGFSGWQVFYATAAGDIRLPVGYSRTAPIDASDFLAAHPQHLGD
jgi:hypothetical protein